MKKINLLICLSFLCYFPALRASSTNDKIRASLSVAVLLMGAASVLSKEHINDHLSVANILRPPSAVVAITICPLFDADPSFQKRLVRLGLVSVYSYLIGYLGGNTTGGRFLAKTGGVFSILAALVILQQIRKKNALAVGLSSP